MREGIDQKLQTMAFPYKIKGWKKLVPNLHFWAKFFRHFDDLQSNLFFPRSVRIGFSRSVILNLVQRVLQEEIRFFTKKVIKIRPKFQKTPKIFIKRSSVGHFGTSPTPKCTVFKALFENDRDIAPKPLKWRFKNDFADHFFFSFFRYFWPYGYKIDMAI